MSPGPVIRVLNAVARRRWLVWLVVLVIVGAVFAASAASPVVYFVFFLSSVAGLLTWAWQAVRGYNRDGSPSRRRLARQAATRQRQDTDRLAAFNRIHPPIPDPLFSTPQYNRPAPDSSSPGHHTQPRVDPEPPDEDRRGRSRLG